VTYFASLNLNSIISLHFHFVETVSNFIICNLCWLPNCLTPFFCNIFTTQCNFTNTNSLIHTKTNYYWHTLSVNMLHQKTSNTRDIEAVNIKGCTNIINL